MRRNFGRRYTIGTTCLLAEGTITTAFTDNRIISGQSMTITLTGGETIPDGCASFKINELPATSVVRVSDTVMTGVVP